MRLQEKQRAINLRKTGKSYNEILEVIPDVSKSTLSRWLSNLQLTVKEQDELQRKLNKRISGGLIRATQTIRNNKIERVKNIYISAQKLFHKFKNDPLFISGLMLYWAEGSKTTQRVQFINSDYRLVVLTLKWLHKYVGVNDDDIRLRLYIHKIYAHENHELFWHGIINLPEQQFLKTIYKPTNHTVKRNPNYRGCLRVDAGGVKKFYTIMCWEEELAKNFNLSPSSFNG